MIKASVISKIRLVYGANINDINMDVIAEYAQLVGYEKAPLQYLRENNDFVTINKKEEEEAISMACILLFGKNYKSTPFSLFCHKVHF